VLAARGDATADAAVTAGGAVTAGVRPETSTEQALRISARNPSTQAGRVFIEVEYY
jgi:hypothetical protein